MNWKGFGRKHPWRNLTGGAEENQKRKTSGRVGGVVADISTELPSDTSCFQPVGP
jgi:hypothetical protein